MRNRGDEPRRWKMQKSSFLCWFGISYHRTIIIYSKWADEEEKRKKGRKEEKDIFALFIGINVGSDRLPVTSSDHSRIASRKNRQKQMTKTNESGCKWQWIKPGERKERRQKERKKTTNKYKRKETKKTWQLTDKRVTQIHISAIGRKKRGRRIDNETMNGGMRDKWPQHPPRSTIRESQ